MRDYRLHTVCEQSLCPNISECFSLGLATFLILGDICTRNCRFCRIVPGQPGRPDPGEPERVKKAVALLGLNYVVITSPTRDDLGDGGADIFCRTVAAVKSLASGPRVEILIPDFGGKEASWRKVAASGAEVVAHNLETVPSLYKKVRPGADYRRSLKILGCIKEDSNNIATKSGLMLGLGEKDTEIMGVLQDLRQVNCDFLTLGQYLPPSLKHYPLKDYIRLDKFSYFQDLALKMGFKGVKSRPYVRSSYRAHSWEPSPHKI